MNLIASPLGDNQTLPKIDDDILASFDLYRNRFRLDLDSGSYEKFSKLLSTLQDAQWEIRTFGVWADTEMVSTSDCVGAAFDVQDMWDVENEASDLESGKISYDVQLKVSGSGNVLVAGAGKEYVFRNDLLKILLELRPDLRVGEVIRGGRVDAAYQRILQGPEAKGLSAVSVLPLENNYIDWVGTWFSEDSFLPLPFYVDELGWGEHGQLYPFVVQKSHALRLWRRFKSLPLVPVFSDGGDLFRSTALLKQAVLDGKGLAR